MAVQTINSNTNIDAVAGGDWRAMDSFTINNGATLTVNTDQVKIISGITVAQGKLRIENPSTSNVIRLRMGHNTSTTAVSITTSSGLSSIEVEGNWIEVGTGDGTPGQVLTLPVADHIPALWVDGEIWTNILTAMTPDIKSVYDGWNAASTGDRGKFFRQIPVADPRAAARILLTGCGSVVGSRILTVPSTAGIEPGARVQATAGFAANDIVERVISATELEMMRTASATAVGFIVTIFNPPSSQFTNQIEFGDGVRGNILPAGAVVRMPNIILGDYRSVDQNISIYNTAINFNLSAGGSMTANKAVIFMRGSSIGGAQKLHLRNVATVGYQNPSKIYDLVFDSVAVGAQPMYLMVSNEHWRTYGALDTALLFQYCKGEVRDLVVADAIAGGSGSQVMGAVQFQYSSGTQVDGVRINNLALGITRSGWPAMGIGYTNDGTFKNIKSYGFARPILEYLSSNNQIEDVEWAMFNHTDVGTTVFYYNAGRDNTFDFDAEGLPIELGTRYYVRCEVMFGANEGMSYLAPERSITTFKTPWLRYLRIGQETANSVRLSWSRTMPVHNAPSYEIFRSTDPLVPVRDASTRIFTTNSNGTITYLDAGLTPGQTYHYVLRKHNSASDYFDTPPQEITISEILAGVESRMLWSTAVDSGTWVKSNMAVSTANSESAAGPFYAKPGSFILQTSGMSAPRMIANAANATVTNTVTGLVIGETYTFSGYLRFQGRVVNGQPERKTSGVRVSFGTAFKDLEVGDVFQRFDVVFVATATSHNAVIRVNTLGDRIDPGVMHVVRGNRPGLAIFAQSSSNTGLIQFDPSVAIYCRDYGDSRPPVLAVVNEATAYVGICTPIVHRVHISKTPGFTPSLQTAVISDYSGGDSIGLGTNCSGNKIRRVRQLGIGGLGADGISVDISSADNVFEDIEFNEGAGRFVASGTAGGLWIGPDSNRNTFRRIRFGSYNAVNSLAAVVVTANDSLENTFENVTCKTPELRIMPQGLGMTMKGLAGGKGGYPVDGNTTWTLGDGLSTIDGTLTAVYDTHFAELDHSNGEGSLNLLFTASTKEFPPYELSANAAFSNTGALYLTKPGASYTFTWPHKIIGVSGFRALPFKFSQVDLYSASYPDEAPTLLVEFQIDTGSGWTEWARATPDSLAALSVDAHVGFYLRLRLTARPFFRYTTQSNEYVVGEVIRAATGGGTATVSEVYDFGSSGYVVVENLTGTWGLNTNVVRDSDGQARSNTSPFNAIDTIAPSFTSLLRGFQIWVNRDPTALYPLPGVAKLTLTDIPAGAEVRIRRGSHTLAHVNDVNSGSFTYEWSEADGGRAKAQLSLPGYTFDEVIFNLGTEDQVVPVNWTFDPSYLPS